MVTPPEVCRSEINLQFLYITTHRTYNMQNSFKSLVLQLRRPSIARLPPVASSHIPSPSPLTTSLLEHNAQALGTRVAGLTPAHGCLPHISWSSSLPTLSQDHPRKKPQRKQAVQLESLSASCDFVSQRLLSPREPGSLFWSSHLVRSRFLLCPVSPHPEALGVHAFARDELQGLSERWHLGNRLLLSAAVSLPETCPCQAAEPQGNSPTLLTATEINCSSKPNKGYGHRLNPSDAGSASTPQDSVLHRTVCWNKRLLQGFLISWEEF